MQASAVIGRVGGLAVALGIGALAGGAGTAWASPADSSAGRADSEQSAPDAGTTRTQALRPAVSRAERRARVSSAASGAAGRQSAPRPSAAVGGGASRTSIGAPQPVRITEVAHGPTDSVVVLDAGAALSSAPTALVSGVEANAVTLPGAPASVMAAAVPKPATASATVDSVLAPPPGTDPLAPVESAMTWTMAAATRRDTSQLVQRPGAAATSAGLTAAAQAPVVIATIPVGMSSPDEAVLSPSGNRLYLAAFLSGVAVIDTTKNTVISRIPTRAPIGVAISPNGSRLYVANQTDAGTVSVIDTSTNTVLGKPISVGRQPGDVAISPNGARLYVTNSLDDSVSVIDTASNTTIGNPIPVGHRPAGVVVSPNGSRAYVANCLDGTLSVIDTATNKVVGAPISVGSAPWGLAFSPNGNRLYVANRLDNTVSVIDATSNTAIGNPIRVGKSPYQLTVSPDGSRVYVSNSDSGSVSVIDTATNTIVGSPISVGVTPFGFTSSGPGGVAVSPNGGRLYVGYYGTTGLEATVAVIDTGQQARANTVPVIAKPVVGSPAAGTGVVTGQVTATDAEKDKLTYSAPATAGKGQVSINAATGAFTYTPTDAARVAAAMPNANAAAQADSFTVTVSDGYGGSTSVSVPVKVAPAPLPKLDLKANGDTGYLLERVLKQESNQIAVDIVKDNKGTYRVIAFISGTGGSTGSNYRNLAAYKGTVDDAEKKLFLDALTNGINEAKKLGTKNPEVMLVGYSQGGMDAQNIAKDNQNLNITTVVTFASPINKKYDELGPNTKVIHLEASEDRIPGILKGETPPKPDQVFTAPTGLPRPPGDDVKVASDLIATDILSRIAGWTKAWVHDIRPQYLNGQMAPPAYLTVANAFDKSTDSKYKDIKASIDKFVGDSSTVISRSTFVGGARVFWAKDKNGNEVKYLVKEGLSGIYGEGNPVFVLQPVSQYKQP